MALRATASLARLRRDQGRHAEARDLLKPVYGWFTEGFNTPDLKENADLGTRPSKGAMNIMTRDLKEMILGALDDAGGREYLHKQATVNPTAFMSLVGKVLPTTLVGDPKRPIHVSVTEEERRREVDAAIDDGGKGALG